MTRRWNYIRHDGEFLYSIGWNADGTLYNPNGYPEERARAALEAAEERAHQRRSSAAKKGAETRRKRIEAKVYTVARRIVDGHVYGPSNACVICERGLADTESIERGIGSECWQAVLARIEHRARARSIA
jgi:Family of unknown function (DUF6011)